MLGGWRGTTRCWRSARSSPAQRQVTHKQSRSGPSSARAYLTHFLEVYRQPDQWTEMAKRALAALDRPRAQRKVTLGQEGNILD